MPFPHDEDHTISFDEGAVLTANYRNTMTGSQVKGGYFSRAAIELLLDQADCAGIRIYYGLTSSGMQEMVVVGVDNTGNDQIGNQYSCLDSFVPCPDHCGEDNILNS
jgi:hypothetical protein